MSGAELREVPDKLYFKIGEVARLLGVRPYVLRYWQSEFKEIAPVKSRTNQRLYRKRDLEILLQIKQLLYQDGFTIEGARKKIRALGHGESQKNTVPRKSQIDFAFPEQKSLQFLVMLRKELLALLKRMGNGM